MTEFFNRTSEKDLRRRLRKDMPAAERRLWHFLRDRQMLGHKFRRQYSVGPYVLDFYCAELQLGIELDGDTHFGDGAEKRDSERERYIERFGIRIVRFANEYVYRHLEAVLDEIAKAVTQRMAKQGQPHPNPPLSKGREPEKTSLPGTTRSRV